ncbi:MAG: hypothetical protein WDW38_001734 [Sanguina aurantia]
MSKGPDVLKTFKYGMPIYGLAWPAGDVFYICGGGGSTASGIKNRLVMAQGKAGGLSDQVADFNFGSNCPMRLAVTPDSRSIVFAMGTGGLRRLDVNPAAEAPKPAEVSDALQARMSQVKGEVKSLAFNASGTLLALGGDDGSLAVHEWPSMDVKMNLSGDRKLKDSVKDVDFSTAEGSTAVAAVLDNGSLELWDWESGRLLSRLERPKGHQFKSDRVIMMSSSTHTMLQQLPAGMEAVSFSRVKFARDGTGRMLTLLNNRSGCFVGSWVPRTDGMVGMVALHASVRASEQPGGCFDVSADGSKVAVGDPEGGVVVLRSQPLLVLRRAAKCHMVFTTAVAFSPDGLHLLSTSADASVTLTSTLPQSPSSRM